MTTGQRVMRILTRPNLGGPTRQAIALWHAHRELGLSTLLVTGSLEAHERLLSPADHGVPRIAFDEACRSGRESAGWVEVRELGRGIHPLRDRRALRRLRELIAACRPEVVHTHTSKAGWLGRKAAFAAGVPVVVHTFHGHVLADYFGNWLSRRLAGLERRLAVRTSHLLAVSDSCADELAQLGVAERARFRVVPPAVELPTLASRAEARQQLGIEADARCVAAVGRLVPIKRSGDLVTMVGQDPGLTGDLIGDGPERAALTALAERTAPGRVTMRDTLSDAGRWLPAYDALVLPSRREGCPLVAVEAFAAGVPVIGYAVPGVRDVLTHWGHGLLVPQTAGPAGLLAAFGRLENDPDLRQECIERARAGLGRFSPAAVARALADTYAAV